jgi:uncharacterized RDD family membrane protein YckC
MTARIERTTLMQTEAGTRAQAQAHVERFRAPFSLRCGAMLIDYIILAAILAFSTLVARLMGGGARMAGGSAEKIGIFVALGVTLVNFFVLTGWRGQTLGKWATGLRIERKDGRRLSPVRSIVRHLIGYPLSMLTLGLGLLLAVFDSRGRALHDFIAGTVVVRDAARRTRHAR